MRAWKGLPSDVLERAGVFELEPGITVIPYRNRAGDTVQARYVRDNGRRWWDKGSRVMPYGLETLAGEGVLAIVEGESDTLAIRATLSETLGWDVLGCPGSSAWRAEWAEYLEPYELVLVMGDGDKAGRGFMDRVQASHPPAVKVWLGEGDDVRGLVQGRGSPFVLRLAKAAVGARAAWEALGGSDTPTTWGALSARGASDASAILSEPADRRWGNPVSRGD